MEITSGNKTLSEAQKQLYTRLKTSRTFRLPYTTACIAHNIDIRFQLVIGSDGDVIQNATEYAAIEKQIAEVMNGKSGKWGCLFAGNVGNGKTSMLRAVQIFCLDLVMANVDCAEGMRLVSAQEVVDRAFNASMWSSMMDEPFLAIDDIGIEPLEVQEYGVVRYPVRDMLQYRYNNHLMTFLSTNLTPQERTQKYGLRLTDRLHEMCQNIVFKSKSFR